MKQPFPEKQLFKTACFSLVFLMLVAATGAWAEPELHTEKRIDWSKGELGISFTIYISGESDNPLNYRNTAESRIQQYLPIALQEALAPLYADSFYTLADIMATDSTFISRIEDIAESAVFESSHLSADLTKYEGKYTFSLYPDILSIFNLHEVPLGIQPRLSWVPSADYTGLVIYMKGEYPVHGENTTAELQPCFFPRIFDSEMNLIVSMEMMDPLFLKQWGVCGYTDSFKESPYLKRIGPAPLHASGTGIFGKNRTDIILTDSTADQLLYSEHNRELLKEGRILIIIN